MSDTTLSLPDSQSTSRNVRRRGAVLGGASVVGLLLLAGLFLPLPYDPIDPDASAILQPPSSAHWFGTDMNGFDIYSRTIAAGARDLPVVLIGTLLSLAIGVPAGLLVSTKARWSEWVMRGLDAFQSFPLLVLAIVIVTVTGNNLSSVVLAIVIINVPRFMRLIRSQAITLRESRFVEAAFSIGASNTRVMLRHLLPNVTEITLAQSALATAHGIIVIAGLSFLGVGVNIPEPSWGHMVRVGAATIPTGNWWTALFPSLAVFAAIVGSNLVADGLEPNGRGIE